MQTQHTVRDVMTKNPVTLPESATLAQAARAMRDSHIGVVLVNDRHDRLMGLVTDRDIVVRAIAEGDDPNHIPVSQISSRAEFKLEADAPIADAVQLMSKANVRRIPVVEGDRCVGIVSLGDLAIARDPNSALGQISKAPSNN